MLDPMSVYTHHPHRYITTARRLSLGQVMAKRRLRILQHGAHVVPPPWHRNILSPSPPGSLIICSCLYPRGPQGKDHSLEWTYCSEWPYSLVWPWVGGLFLNTSPSRGAETDTHQTRFCFRAFALFSSARFWKKPVIDDCFTILLSSSRIQSEQPKKMRRCYV